MKNRKGLTLIELIVSIALVGVLAIVVLNVFSSGFLNIVKAGNRTQAVNAAENEIFNNPIVEEEKVLDILIPVPGMGQVEHQIKGSIVTGLTTINQGTRSEVQAEIKTFMPNYLEE